MELMVFFINLSCCYSVPSLFLRKGTPVHVYEKHYDQMCWFCSQHKKEFLSFKSKFTYPLNFVTTPVQKEQPEIMSVYDLLVFMLTVM